MHAEHVAWVTGQESPNRTGDAAWVYGTDLGICWDDGQGGVLVAFGDTYGPGWHGHEPGGWRRLRPWSIGWRTNVLARSTDRDLNDGMRLDSWVSNRAGRARQAVPRGSRLRGREHTLIPTAGIADGDRQYLAYMSVRTWGPPGRWRTNHAGIAYSDDRGTTWHKPASARWANDPGGSRSWQLCAFARYGDHVYVFGTPNGRDGAARLARVPAGSVLDVARYERWTGSGWGSDESCAAVVLPAPVGELSVLFHEPTGQWLAGYPHEGLDGLVVRTAPELTGPWSQPHVIASGARWPGIYGVFFHPWSARMDTPYFLASQWGPYNVMLMRLHLDADA